MDFGNQFGISYNPDDGGFGPGMYTLTSDIDDARQVAPYQQGDAGAPWWQNAIQYGIVRAIDNQFGAPQQVYGNTNPGTFAGQNGQSYSAYGTPAPVRAGVLSSVDAQTGGLGGLLLLLGAGYLILKAVG